GPSFGSVGGPGGAPSALTVGATDTRAANPSVRVVLRRGLQVVLDQTMPLLGAVAPRHPLTLRVGAPRASTRGLAGSRPVEFFGERGFRLGAGRVAIAPAGDDPQAVAVAAARAGAAAVLLYGNRLPAGALGVSNDVTIPVVAVPAGPALALLAVRGTG